MSMFRCEECGYIFEEGEQKRWVEPHGEELCGCPICGGAFVKVKNCVVCGEISDTEYGVCQKCFDEKITAKNCFEFCGNEKQNVSINVFIAEILEPSKIEAVLMEHISKGGYEKELEKFAKYDEDWFAEKIEEQEQGK